MPTYSSILAWRTPRTEGPGRPQSRGLHRVGHDLSDFPGGTGGKAPTCQCRRHKRHGFDPGVGKIPEGYLSRQSLRGFQGRSLSTKHEKVMLRGTPAAQMLPLH